MKELIELLEKAVAEILLSQESSETYAKSSISLDKKANPSIHCSKKGVKNGK